MVLLKCLVYGTEVQPLILLLVFGDDLVVNINKTFFGITFLLKISVGEEITLSSNVEHTSTDE